MATLSQGTRVNILSRHLSILMFPPPEGAALRVAIHPRALSAPWSVHTQLVGIDGDEVTWAGGVGEDLLQTLDEPPEDKARDLLASRLLGGDRLYEIIFPGRLLSPEITEQFSTIYMSDETRPWIVVGGLGTGDLLAVPLNRVANKQWFTPIVYARELILNGARDSIVELAHVWALPAALCIEGYIEPSAHDRLDQAINNYFTTKDDRRPRIPRPSFGR